MKRILSVLLCLTLLSLTATFPAAAREPDSGSPYPDVLVPATGGATVLYTWEDQTVSRFVRAGTPLELDYSFGMRQSGNNILVGWQTDSGTEYYYDNTVFYPDGETDLVLQDGETCTLYPIWRPIALRKEEVFSFTNSESVFNADLDGYLFTRQHFLRILPNWFFTFALSPLAPLAALFCAFYLFIWPTMDFYGSCCGFAIAALLQHYGKIDLLSEQGVSNVCELQPDETIQSTINYYNIHASAAHLTNHIALQPGTEEYGKQLHALYDTLEGGTPVYFELYGDCPHLLRILLTRPTELITGFDDLTAHGILLTGAYTDGNGNHILIAYDNNSMDYANGRCDTLYIDPDFTQIYSSYAYGNDDDALNGFSWNDSVEQFDAFKTEGVSNPISWHICFLKNFPSLLRQIIALYKTKN